MTSKELGEWFIEQGNAANNADMSITADFQREIGNRLIRLHYCTILLGDTRHVDWEALNTPIDNIKTSAE